MSDTNKSIPTLVLGPKEVGVASASVDSGGP